MAFQLALGCTGGTTHRECCDECDPTTCNLTVVHEVDGSITVTWEYSSPYQAVTAATLNGIDILGDPNYDTGIVTYALADMPDELTLIVTNVCGDSTCEFDIPCCWKYDTLRVSFRNVADIALSCSEYNATAQVRQYDFTLDITGLTSLNGTWLLDTDPTLCNVDEATDIYVGDVTYDIETIWSGPRPFGPGTYEEERSASIPGKLYIRKVSPTGIILVFVPDSTTYTLNTSYWDNIAVGSPVVGSTDYCLDTHLVGGTCVATAWIVGFVTQPSCGDANTDYLETAIYTPFSQLEKPPLYDESQALPPQGLFGPPFASRCSSLIANVTLEVDVEYV
jgi:hypothetical protein